MTGLTALFSLATRPARVAVLLALASAGCAPLDEVPAPTGAISTGALGGPAIGGSPVRGSQSISVASAGMPTGGYAPGFPTAESSPTGAELALVTRTLEAAQARSFAVNAEHCGYVGLDPRGNLTVTEVLPGTEASCTLPSVPPGFTVLASFHTHGTYSPYYQSEFPTAQDLMTDAADGIDGYIATPGGRLWYHDSDTLTVRQLCGRGCLSQDPNYDPTDDGDVRPSYTLTALQAREG